MRMSKEGEMRKLLILYATQTGNALDAAERISRESERRGCKAVLFSLDQYDASLLPCEDVVIFVVSTTGQGDTPESMKVFWRFLLQRNLSPSWLDGLHYAVFGLGDSCYQKYNFVAKKLDKRLYDLGAMAVIERGLGDDQHPSGYEGALDPWLSSLWRVLNQMDPKFFPNGPDFVILDTKFVDKPKYHIKYHAVNEVDSESSTISVLQNWENEIQKARGMSPGRFSGSTYRPDCFLNMVKNQHLTKSPSIKDVRHFEFEFTSTAIPYRTGDILEILPGQNHAIVDAFLERCNLDPELLISVHSREEKDHILANGKNTSNAPMKLKNFVQLAMDVSSASPRRYVFEVMSYFAEAQHEKERLLYFASSEGRDDLYEYNQKERRTFLEVLEDFPSVQLPLEWLVQLVPPLKTRAFSISSSPLVHPNQVHLTVSVVSLTTPFKRKRAGLCSTWLANLDPSKGTLIPAWFKKGCLPLPPPSLPLILVGPGTGCAPFRGFIEERALQSQSTSTAPVMFFFGCRNEENDFLYKDFWLSHAKSDGVLSESKGGGFFVAFSRDQPRKVYVQDKMREHGPQVWSLMNSGAAVYVAGSSTKMPSDVWSALEDVVAKEGEVPKESAVRWLRSLEKSGRPRGERAEIKDEKPGLLTKLLLNVTIQGSVGAVHVVMSPESTVGDLIAASVGQSRESKSKEEGELELPAENGTGVKQSEKNESFVEPIQEDKDDSSEDCTWPPLMDSYELDAILKQIEDMFY
ncbi:hypothetical protein MLD38_008259 [Melastoma candidum]|uniref:Uncharacterized protein n=1 Tax=Melastoma candidum TaxID=119954 RepID=A0ACB9RY29_9MYRT|nr:hypothetical protein MLD38_008259 [Melastoma candidum]